MVKTQISNRQTSLVCISLAIVLCCLSIVSAATLNQYSVKISTFAGGNGEFVDPQKLARLSNGDILVTDATGNMIKKINGTTGVISIVAGNGTAGSSGDGGLAINALVSKPYGIAVSQNDEIYFADSQNNKIRKIDTAGVITTVVGNGTPDYAGDGGLATACSLKTPMDVSLSTSGEMYIADMYNYRIRKVMTNGTIVTFAGTGQPGHTGDGGQATSALLGLCYGVRVYYNEVYISDSFNFKVRKVDVNTGVISLVAGSGVAQYNGDNILATAANLNHPTDVLRFDSGELVIADTDNYRVRLVMANGTIITTAGNGTASFSDGEFAEENGLSLPTGFLMIANGLLVADAGNKRIRLLESTIYSCFGKSTLDSGVCNGQGKCIANNVCKCNAGYQGPTCLSTNYYITTIASDFKDPQRIAKLSNGDYIISDAGDHSIKKISVQTGVMTRIAGNGIAGSGGDGGLATKAQLNKPYGIAVTVNDEIYIADSQNHRIRFIDVNGNISTVVGTSSGYSGDGGFATSAQLNTPMDVSVGTYGDIYIADMYNYRIRRVNSGNITTFAGTGQSGYTGDGGQATSALFGLCYGVKVLNNEVYISDSFNFKVRKVASNGVITTVAGTGTGAFNGEGLLATASNLNHPADVALLPSGELLIVDTDNYRLRMILLNGTMITLAGNGAYGPGVGDFGLAKNAALGLPTGVLITQDGILFTESSPPSGNAGGRVRMLSTSYVPPLCNGMTANDPYVCNGRGQCIGKDLCQCNAGFNGTFCANAQCTNPSAAITIPCYGNGNCTSDVCTCAPGYYGPYCALSVVISSSPFSHPMLGIYMMASINSLAADGISNVDYTWSQVSGPTISNLATLTTLTTPTFIIPGKFNALSLNNGLISGSTYGFSLTAKIKTYAYTTTVTMTNTVTIQNNPSLTFTLQDASTNQAITSGVAGTTVFKVNITSNSNPYGDSSFKYGFGFADSNSITILTDMSEGPATFKLPFISGQSSIDIYVGCQGTTTYSIQKLTTITLTNPVSNLPASQAITTIQNLFTSNSSAADLLGAASILNTVSTTNVADIANKQNIRSSIISTLSKGIANGDLGAAIKALSTVTSVPSEITATSADNTFGALLGGTSNPSFTRNDISALINIASNVLTSASTTLPTQLANSIGSKLLSTFSNGDIVSNAAANLALVISKGQTSFSISNSSVVFPSKNTRFLGCFFVTDPSERNICFMCCVINARTGKNYDGQRSIKGVTYTIGSSIYDFTPAYENGTLVTGNYSAAGNIEITIPYTGSLTPVCGLFDSVKKTYSVNTKATLIKQNGSVICKTSSLTGNVLLLTTPTATSSNTVTPKKSTVVGGSESIHKLSVFLACILLLISMLL